MEQREDDPAKGFKWITSNHTSCKAWLNWYTVRAGREGNVMKESGPGNCIHYVGDHLRFDLMSDCLSLPYPLNQVRSSSLISCPFTFIQSLVLLFLLTIIFPKYMYAVYQQNSSWCEENKGERLKVILIKDETARCRKAGNYNAMFPISTINSCLINLNEFQSARGEKSSSVKEMMQQSKHLLMAHNNVVVTKNTRPKDLCLNITSPIPCDNSRASTNE